MPLKNVGFQKKNGTIPPLRNKAPKKFTHKTAPTKIAFREALSRVCVKITSMRAHSNVKNRKYVRSKNKKRFNAAISEIQKYIKRVCKKAKGARGPANSAP